MQTVAIKINDAALENVMYILKNLSKDVEIVGSFEIEPIEQSDDDYKLLNATTGEKSYKIDDVLKRFE